MFESGGEDFPVEPIEKVGAAAPADVPDQILPGKTVLLVEDSLIIALDAEDILRRLGAEDVPISATPEGSVAELERTRPAFAVLDINLGEDLAPVIAGLVQAEPV